MSRTAVRSAAAAPAGLRRVLMTTDAIGGVWPYSLELGRSLAERGIEVLLAIMGDAPRPAQRQAAEAIPSVHLEWAPHRLEWMPGADADFEAAGDWLQSLAQRFAPDIVHLNGFAHAALDWQVPVVVVAHSCVLTWWRAVHGEDPPSEWDSYVRRVHRGLDGADVVIAPTAAFLDDLTAAYGSLASARVVANGRKEPAPAERRLKSQHVLCAARVWDEAKNVRILDAAAAQLDWPICVAGATKRPDGLPVDLPGHLRFLGSLTETALRSRSDQSAIFVSPALYEPFGLAVLEAAQSGCALVLSDIPTFHELWDGAAMFVDPHDAGAWTEVLATLCADPSEVATYGARAAARARRYTAGAMVEGTLTAYGAAADRYAASRLGPPRAPVSTYMPSGGPW